SLRMHSVLLYGTFLSDIQGVTVCIFRYCPDHISNKVFDGNTIDSKGVYWEGLWWFGLDSLRMHSVLLYGTFLSGIQE
ncbi:MAG: hypothetical protein RJQ14_23345, partial [Marinoscillum sp.]